MNEIAKRVIGEAHHILETGDTIRTTAFLFKVSKSTVHKDMQERLIKIDKNLYNEIFKILKYHTDIRHIRGGEATKQKYQKQL